MFKDSDIQDCEFLLQFHHWDIWYISACFLLLQNEDNDGTYPIELLSLKRIMPAKYLARYLGECIWVAASSSTTHPSHCSLLSTACHPPSLHWHTWLLFCRNHCYNMSARNHVYTASQFLLRYYFLPVALILPLLLPRIMILSCGYTSNGHDSIIAGLRQQD